MVLDCPLVVTCILARESAMGTKGVAFAYRVVSVGQRVLARLLGMSCGLHQSICCARGVHTLISNILPDNRDVNLNSETAMIVIRA